jgi:hypothetical protein
MAPSNPNIAIPETATATRAGILLSGTHPRGSMLLATG